MKHLLTLCVVLVVALSGCDRDESVEVERTTTDEPSITGEDVKRELREAAEATGEYLNEKRKAFAAEAEAKWRSMRQSIDEWNTDEADPKFEAWKQSMAEYREAAEQKLAALKDATAETWDELKEDADAATEKMREHWENGKAQFGSDADNTE